MGLVLNARTYMSAGYRTASQCKVTPGSTTPTFTMSFIKTFLLAGLATSGTALASRPQAKTHYVDWKTAKFSGVNLGGWLVQEATIDTP